MLCPRCAAQLHSHWFQEFKDGIVIKELYELSCEHGHHFIEERK